MGDREKLPRTRSLRNGRSESADGQRRGSAGSGGGGGGGGNGGGGVNRQGDRRGRTPSHSSTLPRSRRSSNTENGHPSSASSSAASTATTTVSVSTMVTPQPSPAPSCSGSPHKRNLNAASLPVVLVFGVVKFIAFQLWIFFTFVFTNYDAFIPDKMRHWGQCQKVSAEE